MREFVVSQRLCVDCCKFAPIPLPPPITALGQEQAYSRAFNNTES